jgi:hypothetical protein
MRRRCKPRVAIVGPVYPNFKLTDEQWKEIARRGEFPSSDAHEVRPMIAAIIGIYRLRQQRHATAAAACPEKAAEESNRKAGTRKQHNPAPRHKPGHRHHARDGDRGNDGGDDGGDGDAAPDVLVPDPDVCRELAITSMTVWRWDRDPAMAELGWPVRVTIRKRNFRFRRQLEQFKQTLMQRAIAMRAQNPRAAAAK